MNFRYILKFGFYFLVLLAIYISSICYSNRSVSDDPPQIVLRKSTDMYFKWDKDYVTKVSLKAGDSLSVLAHASSTSTDGKQYWVETRDGQRGLVSQDDADNGMAANNIPEYNRMQNLGTLKMSQNHFNEMCTTKTPAELDELWDLAEFVCHTDSGITMRYQVAVLKKDDGKIYRPVVTFQNDSLSSVSWGEPLVAINGWLLRILPASSAIVDGWHQAIDGFYYPIQFFDPYPWYIYLPGYALLIIIWLIWLFFTFLMVPFLFLALIAMRIPFSFMSTRVLQWFTLGVLFVCAYIWLVLSLVSDHWWFIMVPCLGVIVWLFYVFLVDAYLDKRCPYCGAMCGSQVINDEITSIRLSTSRSSSFLQTLSRKTIIHKIGDKTTHRDIYDENLYQDYKDTYQVYDHTVTVKCNHCGGEWKRYNTTSELINREEDGTHIGTSSYTDYNS